MTGCSSRAAARLTVRPREVRQRLNSGIGAGSTRESRTLVDREQEQVHGTVADQATVFDPVLDRLPEMEPDQDA